MQFVIKNATHMVSWSDTSVCSGTPVTDHCSRSYLTLQWGSKTECFSRPELITAVTSRTTPPWNWWGTKGEENRENGSKRVV